jgi:geranylgeranyl diphosphate synthase, type II
MPSARTPRPAIDALRTNPSRKSRTPPGPVPTARLQAYRAMIDARLHGLFGMAGAVAPRIAAAMHGAVLSRGKRMRPMLTLLAAQQCGGRPEVALDAACAIEMIHAASLVLDDLPCMDDAELRRGQPTTHIAHGEDIAILAAVGLLNAAYGVVAGSVTLDVRQRAEIMAMMARTIGPAGLIGGQEFDLRDRATSRDLDMIARQYHAKTGVLLEAAVGAGAIAAGADPASRKALSAFARSLGVAFQMMDDMLDATATREILMKDVGKDAGRTSVIQLLGADGARARIEAHLQAAFAALDAAPCGAGSLVRFARECCNGAA